MIPDSEKPADRSILLKEVESDLFSFGMSAIISVTTAIPIVACEHSSGFNADRYDCMIQFNNGFTSTVYSDGSRYSLVRTTF